MPRASAIEYVETTWNPTRGCTAASPGCDHCFAEAFARRWRGLPGHAYEEGFEPRVVPEALLAPLCWIKPRRAFVGSMSDLFHERFPAALVAEVLGVMRLADWHQFAVLTKRAARMKQLVSAARHRGLEELEHVWLGVSVEDRAHGLPRLDALRATLAARRFVAFEPLLEDLGELDLSGIDWVIVGGETGPGARPMEAKWARSIRRQCRKARVPFALKGLGGVVRGEEERELDGRRHEAVPVIRAPTVPDRAERARRLELARGSLERWWRRAGGRVRGASP